MRDPRTIVITGASSGIGAALAETYAAAGVTLALTGRDAARLEAVAARCRAAGAVVRTGVLDVCDRDGVARWLGALDAEAPVDLVIANAGISAGTGGGGESAEQVERIFAVNVGGVLNTLQPLIEPMCRRGRGQLALMASLASFRGFPGAPAYCASKAAVRIYGEGLRGALAERGVGVSVICPGFVRTPMTAVNPFPMPLLMEVDDAAAIIRRGLARNRARIAFPWATASVAWLLGALPAAWADRLLRRTPRKP